MKNTVLALMLFIVTSFFSSPVNSVFATETNPTSGIRNPAIGQLGGANPDGSFNEDAYNAATQGTTLLAQFVRLWANAMTIGALLVIFYFLWGAIEWITSSGDTGKLDKARQKMMHAAIGMIILVSSFIILGFISSLLFGEDFDLLNLQFFTPGET